MLPKTQKTLVPAHYLLPSTYLPPLPLFAYLFAAGGSVLVETQGSYVKQTYQNRARIGSPQGALALTVPVSRKGNNTPYRDVEISEHDHWAHQHWQALRTAYDNTPYFPYLAPELEPLYRTPPRFLLDFNEQLTALLCQFIGIDYAPVYTRQYVRDDCDALDLRPLAEPRELAAYCGFNDMAYWQPFSPSGEFIPRLSCIDAICCMGPETRLLLTESLTS